MHTNDTIQRFIFDKADIRGEIVHLHASYRAIMEQHAYPPIIQQILGQCLVAATLLTSIIKFKGELTLQFQGDGPVKLLVAKCTDDFNLRGLCQWSEDLLASDNHENLLGDGKLIVTVQGHTLPKPYQSIIPLNNHSIAKSLEDYFAQSEQLSTRIWLAVDEFNAAGMLLQLLPEKTHFDREIFWEHAVKLGETITDEELLTLSNPIILHRLYHLEDLRLFDPDNVKFNCSCNLTKMENAVRTLGQTESEEILQEKQVIVITCEYCNHEFQFDKVDVAKIFQG